MDDRLDCDGILSLWVCGSVFEEWESIEGGGVAGGGELLLAGVVVSSQSECDASRYQARQPVHFREWRDQVGRFRVGCSVGALLFKTKQCVWHVDVHGSRRCMVKVHV